MSGKENLQKGKKREAGYRNSKTSVVGWSKDLGFGGRNHERRTYPFSAWKPDRIFR